MFWNMSVFQSHVDILFPSLFFCLPQLLFIAFSNLKVKHLPIIVFNKHSLRVKESSWKQSCKQGLPVSHETSQKNGNSLGIKFWKSSHSVLVPMMAARKHWEYKLPRIQGVGMHLVQVKMSQNLLLLLGYGYFSWIDIPWVLINLWLVSRVHKKLIWIIFAIFPVAFM